MAIQVTIRSVYGREHIYPACDKARLFCEIAGTRTLTHYHVDAIKQLGYAVRVVTAQPTEL